MNRQQEYVLRTVEERGVRLIRLWFTDVVGQLKSFAISPAELETAFSEGMHFDGSSIDGFSRVQESDVLARPDAGAAQPPRVPVGTRREGGERLALVREDDLGVAPRRLGQHLAPSAHAATIRYSSATDRGSSSPSSAVISSRCSATCSGSMPASTSPVQPPVTPITNRA